MPKYQKKEEKFQDKVTVPEQFAYYEIIAVMWKQWSDSNTILAKEHLVDLNVNTSRQVIGDGAEESLLTRITIPCLFSGSMGRPHNSSSLAVHSIICGRLANNMLLAHELPAAF